MTRTDVVLAKRPRHILLRIVSNWSVVGREQECVESIESDDIETWFGVLDVELRDHRINRGELNEY